MSPASTAFPSLPEADCWNTDAEMTRLLTLLFAEALSPLGRKSSSPWNILNTILIGLGHDVFFVFALPLCTGTFIQASACPLYPWSIGKLKTCSRLRLSASVGLLLFDRLKNDDPLNGPQNCSMWSATRGATKVIVLTLWWREIDLAKFSNDLTNLKQKVSHWEKSKR